MSTPQTAPVADVAVIGAGVVGSAIARALSGHRLDVVLLDARCDVGDGTSKANTAILHTGFDASPAPWRRGSSPRGTGSSRTTPTAPASPTSRPAHCWWPGTTSSSPRSPA